MRFPMLSAGLPVVTVALQLGLTLASSAPPSRRDDTPNCPPQPSKTPVIPPLEVLPLIQTGPPENRIDTTFYGDGYLQSERDKFFADARTLAEAMANGPYHTVKPLMNFWAAFTPSNQSGISVDCPGNTPFGLYRIGSQYRGLFPGDKALAEATSKSLGTKSDYPVLLGNDPYYGGLDDGFATVTASKANGAFILAHELGHAFLQAKDEYDGAKAYQGCNSANTTTLNTIPWAKWLTEPKNVSNGHLPVQKSSFTMQEYAWTVLNTTTAWQTEFYSTGAYWRYQLQFSLSGLPDKGDLIVTLDNEEINWTPKNGIGEDRWFYNYLINKKLSRGKHVLKFQLLNGQRKSPQLCSTELEEYANEDEFKLEKGFYGLYPTYDYKNQTTYRPTNADCLMRDITQPKLCNICTETLWTNLLKPISLIDNITETCQGQSKVLTLNLLRLADKRDTPVTGEAYTITWAKDGKSLASFTNKTRVDLGPGSPIGSYSASVKFSTDEVRTDSDSLKSEKVYKVTQICPSGPPLNPPPPSTTHSV